MLLALLAVVLVSIVVTKRRRCLLPLPPGPLSLPLIGCFLSIPKRDAFIAYARWSREYQSDVISLNAFGTTIIILNTLKSAQELLERRSTIYSDRPLTTLLSMSGWDFFIGLIPYSDKWRSRRRLFHQSLRKQTSSAYLPLQLTAAQNLMKGLYQSPNNFVHHLNTPQSDHPSDKGLQKLRAAASVTLAIAYGYEVAPQGDSLVEMLEECAKLAIEATLPFASAVNDIPGLKYLPDWFPGMGFKARAKHCRTVLHEVLNAPLEDVQRSMADGTAGQSLASELLKANEASGGGAEGYDAIRDVTGSVYTAGAETTSTAVNSAILALVLHPDVQRRAQAEIDSVIGRDRLPSFDDRASMPYVDAVCREVIRWKIVNPLGLPRRVRSDDVYEGHSIPKGALLFPNTWAIVHDPERYPEPFSFKPERFLLKDGSLNNDDVQMKFGFGRRICPGRHVADASVWIMVSSILAVFDIWHTKDEHGKEIPIDETCVDGLVSRPLPFECAIIPRDAKAATLIRSLA